MQYGKGTITNRSSIRVGKDLNLSAENLDLQGKLIAGGDVNLFAADSFKIEDSLNNPFIASAGSNLLVEGNQVDIFALSHSESGFFSNGGMKLTSANTIKGDARFYSGGNFQIDGNLSSPNDPIVLAGGDAILGDYTGASLHILAGGSVTLGDVEINAADSRENSINPNNTALFNGSDTFASLSEVTLSDGRVINIDGSSKPTLDVRAGIDWNSFAGGLPSNFNPGNVNVNSIGNAATSADITTGNIRIADGGDGGQLLFTNQYRNNGNLTGDILLNGEIDAKDALQGGKLDFDSRGGITVNGIIDASGFEVETVNGGDISLFAAGDIAVNDGAGIFSNGAISGNIILNSGGDITLTRINNAPSITSNSYGNESGVTGGNVDITANSLFLRDGAAISTDVFGAADGGDININANSNIELTGNNNVDVFVSIPGLLVNDSGSQIGSDVRPGATGKAGNINLNTSRLIVSDAGTIGSFIFGNGDSGELSIAAQDIEMIGIDATNYPVIGNIIYPQVTGNLDQVTIKTESLIMNGASIVSLVIGNGNAGKLNLETGSLIINESLITFFVINGSGNASQLNLETGSLIIRGGVLATTSIGGDPVDLNITAENIELMNSQSNLVPSSFITTDIDSGTTGEGGNITIKTKNLTVRDGAIIQTGTFGNGNAGNLSIVAENIELSGISSNGLFGTVLSSQVNPGAIGDGGDLTIETGNLTVGDRAQVIAASSGDGNAGKLDITAEQININQQANISTATFGTGASEELNINTRTLQLNNATINASTTTTQQGGNINVNASESVTVTGAGFESLQQNFINPALENNLGFANFTQGIITTSDGEGAAGNVFIETPNFTVNNGGLIATTALNTGKGGNIDINVTDSITLDNSLLATGTFSEAVAGNINLNARKLTAIGGAQVLTTTFDEGKAGNLNVNVSESIDLIDPSEQGITSGLFASSSQTASGSGGDINVKTGDFNIVDRAAVSVSGEGVGNAGDIDIEALSLFLDNSSITAQSVSGEGGNINLTIADLLLLRNNSTISTRAGTETSGGGNGGNITIDGGLIVAIPNEDSDINANAFEGNGGNITIATPGIFGIQFREQTTPQSDITASSEFGIDGNFDLNLLELDITSGLIELPANLADATDRINAGCPTDEEARFVTSGRGGIPQNPRQVLQNEVVLQDLRNTNSSLSSPSSPSSPSRTPIKEATRWIVNKDGVVEFVANLPQENTGFKHNSLNCS